MTSKHLHRILVTQNRLGKEHFASLHAKTGLVTFGLAMAAPLGGILSFRKLGLLPLLPQQWQAHIKWVHRSVRCVVLGCSVLLCVSLAEADCLSPQRDLHF